MIGVPCPDSPVTALPGRTHGHPRDRVQLFPERYGSRTAQGSHAPRRKAEPRGGPLAHVGIRRGWVVGQGQSHPGSSRQRRGRPASQAPRAGSGHRCARRRSPASHPPAPRAPLLLGWAARHRAPYLCRRLASLRRGRRWPRGHGGRLASRAEPVRVLTSPPGALRVHPGALECSLRTCQIPGPPPLGPASHVLPRPEVIAGTRPGPGESPGSGPHGCGVRGRPGGLRAPRCPRPCHLPRRRSAASAQLPGLMQLPGWSGASGSVAGCATAARRSPGRPDTGPPAWL